MSEDGTKYYPDEELAELLRSFDRAEDLHLFAEDVIRTYPYLAEKYVRVCPQRCDIATATSRAQDGAYSQDPRLGELKADISLMANNCIRFNGEGSEFAKIATAFEQFALAKVDSYIASKTGGRRVSSMRLQSTAPEGSKSGSGRHSITAAAAAKHHVHKDVSLTNKATLDLVSSLIRREDAGAFVVDVSQEYPELKASYEAICPVRMNLTLAKQRAEAGEYLSEDATATVIDPEAGVPSSSSADVMAPVHVSIMKNVVLGNSIADSLTALRADVELIVSNCIRFNAQVPQWAKMALSFRRFAHRRIDDFVLKHAPALRGTVTGTERYAGPKHAPESTGSTQSTAPAPSTSNISSSSPTVTTAGVKRARDEKACATARSSQDSGARHGPAVQLVADTMPTVSPSSLQPSLDIPARLRVRLVADHVRRETVSLRLLGARLPFNQLFPSTINEEEGEEAGAEEGKGKLKESTKGEAATAAAQKQQEAATEMEINAECTVQALLDRFAQSVHAFFLQQRIRSDFEDPFRYSLRDEQLYMDVLSVITQQFERLLVPMLLYEREAAAAREWAAVTASKQPKGRRQEAGGQQQAHATVTTLEGNVDERTDSVGVHWASQLHYTYLVRLLVQLPQITALCCATPSGTASSGQRTLKISVDALDVVMRITRVMSEFLAFVGAYEEKLLGN